MTEDRDTTAAGGARGPSPAGKTAPAVRSPPAISRLVNTRSQGTPHRATSASRDPSSGSSGTAPSTTASTSSAEAMALRLRSTPSCSTGSSVARMPAVSMSRSRTPPQSTDSSTVSRVVPGMSVTMARSYPARALSSEDLPALGRPTIAVRTPDFSTCPRRQVSSSRSSRPAADRRAAAISSGRTS